MAAESASMRQSPHGGEIALLRGAALALLVIFTSLWVAGQLTKIGGGYQLAIEVQSDRTGTITLYFDTGSGFSEDEKVTAPVVAGDQQVRFPLTAPRYDGLRVDPDLPGAEITVGPILVEGRSGQILATIGPDRIIFQP